MPTRRRERIRAGVTEAELLELELGPARGEPSVFATETDRLIASIAYARQREGPLAAWEADGLVLEEIRRRHSMGGHPAQDAGPCPRCPDHHYGSWS